MHFTFLDLITLLGALGFFIYGMKIMSEGIQKVAGSRMRNILEIMTRNRFTGLFTGFVITALVQSSSASTVMTVSFVNAGLISVAESVGVIMGANIGTTIKLWVISYLGFKFKITALTLPIVAFGLPMMFSKKSKTKALGEFLIGFSILFMGLDALSNSVPDLNENPQILAFLSNFTNVGIWSSFLFIFIGLIITVIIQSSSAAMTLTLVMCYNGWIPYQAAAAMVLGENIGTTVTAEIASLVGNVHAKRTARVHSLFNIIGVCWMVWVIPIYLSIIDKILEFGGSVSPYVDPTSMPLALAYFHVLFNVTNVLILIWFVPYLVELANKTVASKGKSDEEFHLEYINSRLSGTSELSILEAKKEILKFVQLSRKIINQIPLLLTEIEDDKFNKTIGKIEKYEDIADKMEIEISDYLTKISEGEISEDSISEVRSIMGITGELERIADICYQMSKVIERKRAGKIWFTPEQRDNLKKMFALVEKAMDHMEITVKEESSQASFKIAREYEEAINEYRNELRKNYMTDINKGKYTIQSGIVYNDIYSSFERIADHVINIHEALVLQQSPVKT